MSTWMQGQAPGRADAASRWLQQQHDQASARTTAQQQAQMMMGNRQGAQAQAFAPHPAMAQPQGAYAQHPAMQQALDQQAHMQSLPHPAMAAQGWMQNQGSPGAMAASRAQAAQAAFAPHPAMGNAGGMQAAQQAAFAPHPAMTAQAAQPTGMYAQQAPQDQQAMQRQQMMGQQAAMERQSMMQRQQAMAGMQAAPGNAPPSVYGMQAQGAVHPAMQQALDQQAHLQSQLGAMRVQPQAASPWNAGPTTMTTMGGAGGAFSPWGGR